MTNTTKAQDIQPYTALANGAIVLEHPAQIFRSLGIVKVCTDQGVQSYAIDQEVEVA